MVNFDALELGRILGGNIRKTDKYREDFVEGEDVKDLLLANLNRVVVSVSLSGSAFYVNGCSVSGVNGGVDPFVLDHPVNGELDGEFFIDGDYCSSSLLF